MVRTILGCQRQLVSQQATLFEIRLYIRDLQNGLICINCKRILDAAKPFYIFNNKAKKAQNAKYLNFTC